jgi:hypothetical protein
MVGGGGDSQLKSRKSAEFTRTIAQSESRKRSKQQQSQPQHEGCSHTQENDQQRQQRDLPVLVHQGREESARRVGQQEPACDKQPGGHNTQHTHTHIDTHNRTRTHTHTHTHNRTRTRTRTRAHGQQRARARGSRLLGDGDAQCRRGRANWAQHRPAARDELLVSKGGGNRFKVPNTHPLTATHLGASGAGADSGGSGWGLLSGLCWHNRSSARFWRLHSR